MIPAKRLEEIRRILRENGQADVSSLASELDVTETTIRRDLEKLENENFLTRTHGGAVLNEQKNETKTIFAFDDEDPEPYENIGRIAASFVSDNDMIFLGPGASSRFVVHYLSDRANVTVVTTDLLVVHDCSVYSPNLTVILTGGYVNTSTLELSGQMAMNSLKSFYFNISFFDIDGITLSRGYSVSSLDKAYLIQNMMQQSKKAFALCPYNRFDTESSAFLGDISMFRSVITNEHVGSAFKEFYFQNKIQIFATFNV